MASIETLAREITEKVAGDTAEILHVRHDLGIPDADAGSIDTQDFRQEAIDLATGEEIGCADEQEALDNCLMTWVRKRLESNSPGVNAIARERSRHVDVEGWTPEHDDQHKYEELRWAARGYLSATSARSAPPAMWPWAAEWWKPSDDPIRNLEKAGALIAAEIDRLMRKAEEQPASSSGPREALL